MSRREGVNVQTRQATLVFGYRTKWRFAVNIRPVTLIGRSCTALPLVGGTIHWSRRCFEFYEAAPTIQTHHRIATYLKWTQATMPQPLAVVSGVDKQSIAHYDDRSTANKDCTSSGSHALM